MTVLARHTSFQSGDTDRLAALAGAMLALRRTAEIGTACLIAGDCAVHALGAGAFRLLRIDSRSGAMKRLEEGGVETPYLAEPGGPVEWVMRNQAAWFDDGTVTEPSMTDREALLWNAPPAALAAVPVFSGSVPFGILLIAFPAPRTFAPDDRLLLQSLADALALALERGELRRNADQERARRVELERGREVTEETSSVLMSLVAHEIRTPLTAIQAYTETLLQSLANPAAPRERFLGIINDECQRLGRLVTDVLDLSRLESGQRPLRLSRFDLRSLIDEASAPFHGIARVRGIAIELSLPDGLSVEADRDLLRRLVGNLLSNALRHSPPGGSVRITVEAGDDAWIASVEDQGPGLPADVLPHVAVRGVAGATGIDGSGLGLAIAGGIVALHGGRLWTECPSGGGARFRFRLPLRQMASPHARRIARVLVGRPDIRCLCEESVGMVAATMDAVIVSLMLVDPERGDLFVAASRGLEGQNLPMRRTAVRSGVAGSVAAWAKPVLVNNIETDRRFQRLNHPQYSTKSLLSVPLMVEGEVLGVVNVNNKLSRASFDEHDLAVLVALVERIGSAVERAIAYPDSEKAVVEAIEAVRSVTRLRERGLLASGDAVRRVRILARELGLEDADVDQVGWVAAIHDIGMTPIHRGIQSSRGPLGDEQRESLARHPEIGVEMLRPIEYVGPVRDMVLAHHEHWDGSGYPRGLRGEEIPLGARAIAVVDAYESMVSVRPWRATRSPAEALEELRRFAGSQFDPLVVDAFVRVLEREADAS